MTDQKSLLDTSVVRKVVRPHRGRFAAVLVLLIADSVLNSLGIGMILPVMQAVLDNGEIHPLLAEYIPFLAEMTAEQRITLLCSVTIALFAFRAAANYGYVYGSKAFSEMLRVQWVREIGESYLVGPYGRIVESKQGALLNNWYTETGASARFFIAYFGFISATLQVIALVTIGLIVHWMAMLAIVAVGAVLLLIIRNTAFVGSAALGARKLVLQQNISAVMSENLLNVRDVKLMGVSIRRLDDLQGLSRGLRDVFVHLAVLSEAPRIIGEFAAIAGLMAFIYVSIVTMGLSPATVLPMVAFFVVAFYRLITAASLLVSARIRALNDLPSLDTVYQLTQEGLGAREDANRGLAVARLETDIEFNAIEYRYDADSPVLNRVSITIPKGKLTLLLGPSGSGKSTLLDLLLRLREPAAGKITANGRDISAFRLGEWRHMFGYVSQDAALFNGTIRVNMDLAKPGVTDAEMGAVFEVAGVNAYMSAFPEGYDTPVGDRGFTLSGGQRKRLAIARALVANPSVLILDEATTSIEEAMERSIIRNIRAAYPDLTIIQVTHRVLKATEADHVVQLEAGRLVREVPFSEYARARKPGPEPKTEEIAPIAAASSR